MWLGDSCWSGFVGRARGWRTGQPTTRCPVRAASWPSSATTAALTSRPKSTRRRNWKRRSTRYRPDCDSAIDRRICQQRERWCRLVSSVIHDSHPICYGTGRMHGAFVVVVAGGASSACGCLYCLGLLVLP